MELLSKVAKVNLSASLEFLVRLRKQSNFNVLFDFFKIRENTCVSENQVDKLLWQRCDRNHLLIFNFEWHNRSHKIWRARVFDKAWWKHANMDFILKLILVFDDLLSPCYNQSMTSELKSCIFEVVKALFILVFSLEIWHLTCQCLLQVEVTHPWAIIVKVENVDVLRILLGIEQ